MTGSAVAGFAAAGAGLAPGVAEGCGGATCWAGPGEAVCVARGCEVAGGAELCGGTDGAPVVGLDATPCGVGKRCAPPVLGVELFGAGDAAACWPVGCVPDWGVGGCGEGACVDTGLFTGLGTLFGCAGGGMAPLAGPYWMMGRAACC